MIDLLTARTHAAQGTAKFVDARSRSSYEMGHIPKAISIPNGDFDAGYAAATGRLNPGDQIVVYCTSADCDEAEQVIARLHPLGYQRLLHFKGGWLEWENANLPQETGPGEEGR